MRALIVCGHEVEGTPDLLRRLSPGFDVFIAADRGASILARAGIQPTVIVGDMDSLDAESLAGFVAQGVPIRRHSPNKDATDLELALEFARAEGVEHVTVVGATGGRLDHTLAAVGSIASAIDLSPELADPGVHCWLLDHAYRSELMLTEIGATVSVLALGGPATLRSSGLSWPLDGILLPPLSGRGVSNVIESVPATLRVGDGLVLVMCVEDD